MIKLFFSTICLFLLFTSCKEERYVGELRDWPGIKNGHLKAFSDSGLLIEEAHYQNDILQGERRLYHPDGNIHIIENYINGSFHGPYQVYFENGKLYVEGNYADDQMIGRWKTYYETGKLKEEVTFSNNLENGPFIEYHENGNIRAEGQYKDGDKEHGLLLLYDSLGVLTRKMECNLGICHTIWKKTND